MEEEDGGGVDARTHIHTHSQDPVKPTHCTLTTCITTTTVVLLPLVVEAQVGEERGAARLQGPGSADGVRRGEGRGRRRPSTTTCNKTFHEIE